MRERKGSRYSTGGHVGVPGEMDGSRGVCRRVNVNYGYYRVMQSGYRNAGTKYRGYRLVCMCVLVLVLVRLFVCLCLPPPTQDLFINKCVPGDIF